MTTHATHSEHAAHAHAKEHARQEPVLNIDKLLERFRFPGIDVAALVDAQRKNVDALREANQKAYAGALALAQRQAEIFEETVREWQDAAKELSVRNSPADIAAKQTEFARKSVEHALGNMRELAEMAVRSQAEAYEVIGKRVQTGIQEFRDYLTKQ